MSALEKSEPTLHIIGGSFAAFRMIHPPTMITIKFLEKLSDRELLLSWREPARCNYTEQLWTLRKAPSATICVLSGEKIRRGDHVYSPAGRPANRSKCIRPEAVQLL